MRPLPALAFLLFVFPLLGCGGDGDDANAKYGARPVLAARVERAAQTESSYTGVVAARTESDLGFRVAGKIVERRVDPGDRVAAGDTLLVLDVENFELALRAARNRVLAAEANLHQARGDVERYQRLAESGAESKRTFELAATGRHVAEAELAAARADAQQIENQRGYSTLVADADGVITDVLGDRGQIVAVGQTVARLAHDGSREAIIHVPETQRALAANPAVAFAFDDPGHAVPALLRELSAAADPVTRTFRARYVLEGDVARLPIGSTVTVRLQSPEQASFTRVPIGALHDSGDGPGVWVIGEQRNVRFSPVRIVKLGQESVVLESGVTAGQHVVALGAHLLHEGDAVRAISAPGEPRPLEGELARVQ